MGENELPLRELRPQRSRERRQPSFANVGLLLLGDKRELLPVHIDAVQVGREHELRHRVGERGRVPVVRGRLVELSKSSDDKRHAFVVVLLLELLASGWIEVRPVQSLLLWAVGEQKCQVSVSMGTHENAVGTIAETGDSLHNIEALKLVERWEDVGADDTVRVYDELGALRDQTARH